MRNVVFAALLLVPGAARSWDRIEGQSSGVRERQMLVVKSREQWSALWKKHAGEAARPDVDFSREIVVAVFMGERPTGGYAVRLDLQPDPMDCTRLYVLYREVSPRPGRMQTDMISQPFSIVKVSKAYAAVVFELNQAARALDPEVGKAEVSSGAPRENPAVAKWLGILENFGK